MRETEFDIDSQPHDEYIVPHLIDAIDLASDQDTTTWLTRADGKRIAAIVPVDRVAELCLRHLKPVRPARDPQVHPFHADGSWCAP
jgi:hypothetical protein